MKSCRFIETDITENAAVVMLNRPEKHNAICLEMAQELTQVFEELTECDNLRCVIITGKGRSFSAGGDINEQSKYTPETAYQNLKYVGQKLTNTIAGFHTPVIAAINGFAFGGGAEIALACDIRIAADNAEISLPEVTLGLMPGWGGTQRALRLLGYSRAFEFICTGKRYTAEDALALGVVSEVVPLHELTSAAHSIAALIAANPPKAVQQIKDVLKEGEKCTLDAALDLECAKSALLFGTWDAHECMSAFIEKRAHRGFRGC